MLETDHNHANALTGVAVGHVGAHSVINPRTGYPILDSYWKHFLQVCIISKP